MNTRIWLTIAISTLLLGCGPKPQESSSKNTQPGKQAGAIGGQTLDTRWPIQSSPNWTIAKGPVLYTPDTLFEYNDGAAPKYLSYGFKELTHTRYAYQGKDLSSVTLDIYEMANPLGAYGIYSSARPRDITPRRWGTESYRSGTVAVGWKRSFYVHAMADDERPVLTTMLEQVMDRVFSMISGEDVVPDILGKIPKDGLIPHTDRYIGKDLLGHSFLPGGFLANYQIGTQEGLLFCSDLKTEEKALDALARLRNYERKQGRVLRSEKNFGKDGFWAKDPGMGIGMVTRAGEYVVGIWGVPSQSAGRRILEPFVANLGQTLKQTR